MVPYRGRLALRIARIALAIACLAWYAFRADERFASILAVLAAYLVYAVGTLFELRLDSPVRARIALIADTVFFGFWLWVVASGWIGWPSSGWISALLCGYVLVSAVMLHDVLRASGVAAVVVLLAFLFAPRGEMPLVWVSLAAGGLGVALSVEKRYLNRRLSHTLRHNVVIRSQAQGAREAERQRIAQEPP